MKKINKAMIACLTFLIVLSTGLAVAESELTVDNLIVSNTATFYGNISLVGTSRTDITSDLVLYYDFASNTNVIQDLSGYGHSGSSSGATWTASGKTNGAYSFDATNDWIQTTSTAALSPTNALTILAWIKLDTAISNTYPMIVTKNPSSGAATSQSGNYEFRVNNNGVLYFSSQYSTNSSQNASGVRRLDDLNWHFVGVTVDATSRVVRLYRDGLLDNSVTVANRPISYTNAEPVRIGRRKDGYYYDGLIDEVRIYNRRLNSDEIMQIYGYYQQNKNIAILTADKFMQTGYLQTNVFMGNVGIGTNSATNALNVAGTASATFFVGNGSLLTSLAGGNIANASIVSTKLANNTITATQISTNSVLVGVNADMVDGMHATNFALASQGAKFDLLNRVITLSNGVFSTAENFDTGWSNLPWSVFQTNVLNSQSRWLVNNAMITNAVTNQSAPYVCILKESSGSNAWVRSPLLTNGYSTLTFGMKASITNRPIVIAIEANYEGTNWVLQGTYSNAAANANWCTFANPSTSARMYNSQYIRLRKMTESTNTNYRVSLDSISVASPVPGVIASAMQISNIIGQVSFTGASVTGLMVSSISGLGSAATNSASTFATAAQGVKADGAVQRIGDTMSGVLGMNSHRITDLATPVVSNDAVTKAYVDGICAEAIVASTRGPRTYATLASVLAGIGTNKVTLVLDGQWDVTTNVTFPKNVYLKFEKDGWLNVSDNVTAQILGGFSAGLKRIFSITGTVAFSNAPTFLPEWWGAISDDEVDDAAAIQKALSTAYAGGVQFQSGTYMTSTPLVPQSFSSIKGSGVDVTKLRFVDSLEIDSSGGQYVFNNNYNNSAKKTQIADMTIDANFDGQIVGGAGQRSTGGICLCGEGHIIRNVKIVQFGTALRDGYNEAWGIILWNLYSNEDAHIVDSCEITAPGNGDCMGDRELNGIVITPEVSSANYPATTNKILGIIRNCYVHDVWRASNGAVQCFGAQLVEDCVAENCGTKVGQSISYGFYLDSWAFDTVICRNNVFRNLENGFKIGRSGWPFTCNKIVIEGNYMDVFQPEGSINVPTTCIYLYAGDVQGANRSQKFFNSAVIRNNIFHTRGGGLGSSSIRIQDSLPDLDVMGDIYIVGNIFGDHYYDNGNWLGRDVEFEFSHDVDHIKEFKDNIKMDGAKVRTWIEYGATNSYQLEFNKYLLYDKCDSTISRDGSLPLLGNLNLNAYRVKNLAAPEDSGDAVTKDYFDQKALTNNASACFSSVAVNGGANLGGDISILGEYPTTITRIHRLPHQSPSFDNYFASFYSAYGPVGLRLYGLDGSCYGVPRWLGVIGTESGNNPLVLQSGTSTNAVTIFQNRVDINLPLVLSDKIGIGTAAPLAPLHVNSSTPEKIRLTGTVLGEWNWISFYENAMRQWYLGNKSGCSDFTIGNDTSPFYHFTIKQNGNVGVGTSNPVMSLDVNGAAVFRGGWVNTVTPGFEIGYSESNGGMLSPFDGANRKRITFFASDYYFCTGQFANGTPVFIDSTGNMGVGTAVPQRKLHISGAMRMEPQVSAPANPVVGDLYMGTDGELHIYKGGHWNKVNTTAE